MLTAISAVLTAWGLACLLWLAFGSLLMPVGRTRLLEIHLPAQGDGADLEQTIYGLHWLQTAGLLEGTLCIVDRGLTPKGRAEVEYLCSKRFANVKFLAE